MPTDNGKPDETPAADDAPAGQTPDEDKRVDSDWKEEARREKERLSGETEDDDVEQTAGRPTGGPLPKPSLEMMVTNLAIQALIAMGEIANPITRKQERDLAQAKHTIDLLGILEEKTRGNLTDDEKKHLEGTLYDLRMRYVSTAQGG